MKYPKALYKKYLELMERPRIFRRLINLYPPYLFAGISVDYVSDDFREVVVSLRSTFYNKNHFGTHFGGSLYSMIDPFYVFMILHNIDGQKYYVWDRRSDIEFCKPGKGRVTARMKLTSEQLRDLERQASNQDKVEPTFQIEVTNESGEVVARCHKTVYIRLKPKYR